MRVNGVPFVQGRNSYGHTRHHGIAIHNTSNTASAAAEAKYATSRTDGTSSHFYVDGSQVVQSLDTSVTAGHAGSTQGNRNAVAVEITGTNDWTRKRWVNGVAWEPLGATLAQVITQDPDFAGFQARRASVAQMRANPAVAALYSHDDMRRAWGGTTHTDPGPNFPWDVLVGAIHGHLSNPTEQTLSIPIEPTEDDMPLPDNFEKNFEALIWRVEALINNRPAVIGGPGTGEANLLAVALHAADKPPVASP